VQIYIFDIFHCLIFVKETYVSGTDFASFVSVYFVSEGQIIPTLTVIVSQGVTEMYVSVLFNGELDNGCCIAVLSVEEK
jgi:hypothetical protein